MLLFVNPSIHACNKGELFVLDGAATRILPSFCRNLFFLLPRIHRYLELYEDLNSVLDFGFRTNIQVFDLIYETNVEHLIFRALMIELYALFTFPHYSSGLRAQWS